MTSSRLFPVLRYRDCDKALEFLTAVFGFVPGTVFRSDEGHVMHAELWHGSAGIMIGPVMDTPFSTVMRQPDQAGGVTASFFVGTEDPDGHFARSEAAGLEIILPLRDESYGSREYSVRDPEGHVWSFGTYDPKPRV